MRIILASESPRRKELLTLMGLDYEIIVSHVEENPPHGAPPDVYVSALALQKAQAVAAKHPGDCVIGADTIVWLDGTILGKPHSEENARAYLSKMQGRRHTVYTGVAVITGGVPEVRVCTTQVWFAPMSQEEIDWYVSTGEPLDKAGAYGVQGPGSVFVERIEGNYFNVIGMPVPILYRMLLNAGVIDARHQQS